MAPAAAQQLPARVAQQRDRAAVLGAASEVADFTIDIRVRRGSAAGGARGGGAPRDAHLARAGDETRAEERRARKRGEVPAGHPRAVSRRRRLPRVARSRSLREQPRARGEGGRTEGC
jgi:hypothetical protein